MGRDLAQLLRDPEGRLLLAAGSTAAARQVARRVVVILRPVAQAGCVGVGAARRDAELHLVRGRNAAVARLAGVLDARRVAAAHVLHQLVGVNVGRHVDAGIPVGLLGIGVDHDVAVAVLDPIQVPAPYLVAHLVDHRAAQGQVVDRHVEGRVEVGAGLVVELAAEAVLSAVGRRHPPVLALGVGVVGVGRLEPLHPPARIVLQNELVGLPVGQDQPRVDAVEHQEELRVAAGQVARLGLVHALQHVAGLQAPADAGPAWLVVAQVADAVDPQAVVVQRNVGHRAGLGWRDGEAVAGGRAAHGQADLVVVHPAAGLQGEVAVVAGRGRPQHEAAQAGCGCREGLACQVDPARQQPPGEGTLFVQRLLHKQRQPALGRGPVWDRQVAVVQRQGDGRSHEVEVCAVRRQLEGDPQRRAALGRVQRLVSNGSFGCGL